MTDKPLVVWARNCREFEGELLQWVNALRAWLGVGGPGDHLIQGADALISRSDLLLDVTRDLLRGTLRLAPDEFAFVERGRAILIRAHEGVMRHMTFAMDDSPEAVRMANLGRLAADLAAIHAELAAEINRAGGTA